jgi:hypothetical protein
MNTDLAALNEYIKQLEAALEKQKEVSESNIRRFFIPTIGTTIKIIKDTPVTIWVEHRNLKFLEKIVPGYPIGRLCWSSYDKLPENVPTAMKWVQRKNTHSKWYDFYTEWSIPKDTRLVVDRVYIRKGKDMKEFDSITFRVEKQKGSKLTGRFWLKRSDVNNLVVEVVKEEP